MGHGTGDRAADKSLRLGTFPSQVTLRGRLKILNFHSDIRLQSKANMPYVLLREKWCILIPKTIEISFFFFISGANMNRN